MPKLKNVISDVLATKRVMRKRKGMFAWAMMLVMLLSGIAGVGKMEPQMAVAASAKCYAFSTEKKTKIGGYYYRINRQGKLQRSKSKSKNFKTVAVSNAWSYLSTGKLIYYINQSESQGKSTIYSCKMNGKSKKKILTVKKYLQLSTIYNNKLYVAKGSESEGYVTYSISLKGKAKLKKEKEELYLFNERYGQYILGAEWMPTDVSSYGVCIYNAKEKKKISLGSGLAACFIGKKVYYASFDEKLNCYSIKRCNLNGSNQEVLTVLDDTIWYVTKVTKTYCEGYSTSGDGLDTVKVEY